MNLRINESEKDLLSSMLDNFIKVKRVEERRTDHREFRKLVLKEQDIAEHILKQLMHH